ncbi:Piso0_005304 [Millerozyma farinosa CBS 7064]|uniref:Piso0_005304 protein n=1 Tax=Pichia sorbitophila (strain ATCC MYA-4447 / BCRC 22081 / CBS 7064 / NBRC 10061 / NRRL Y-12695) TaxID=559304 RepID=G8Y4R5_PICSO|nr:Piso0_005304 [Millerozyma farinosa CBS 7064]
MLFASVMGWNENSSMGDGFSGSKADKTKLSVSKFIKHLKSGTLLTSFYNSTVIDGTTEPSIAHMFIEVDNNAGYNVMASKSKTRGAELRDVIREKDSIDLGANVVEDIDSPATGSRSR